MQWKHQILTSFITGFGVTSGAISALGIGSAIARYIYFSFYKRNIGILDTHKKSGNQEQEQEEDNDTPLEQAETESEMGESPNVQPYEPKSTDYFDCTQSYGGTYDYKKMGTPVAEAYQDAFLQRMTN
ncbi:MAG: hypothetical protein EBU90_13800 [Proteobacteria bacterium]|nr:hypothetical protein [Pseudomonadota bacterium]NBP13577.1 hypothetical protein [bacterium]